MLSKKKYLRNSKLYLILDAQVKSYEELFEIAKVAVRGRVDIIQLRDKTGRAKDILSLSQRILRLTRKQVAFIVNDRVDCALAIGADGVHLGQDDLPLKAARSLIGNKAIIGQSCQTLEHAKKAQKEGADYIGFGSVFKTQTKPDRSEMDLNLLKQVCQTIQIPIFAIGGIKLERIQCLQALGVKRFAVCRAICESQKLEFTIEEFVQKLNQVE